MSNEHKPPTDDELAKWEEWEAQATPFDEGCWGPRTRREGPEIEGGSLRYTPEGPCSYGDEQQAHHDAQFICGTRYNWNRLIAEVQRLRNRTEKARELVEWIGAHIDATNELVCNEVADMLADARVLLAKKGSDD